MEPTVIIALIGGASVVIVAAIKMWPKNSTQNIIDKTNAINDIKHIKDKLKEIDRDMNNLYDEMTKSHAEDDKIMGLISSVRERLARLEGEK